MTVPLYVRHPAINSPDVIPIKDLGLKSIVHAMIQLFPKMRFPREIQCDLGASFTNDLKISFFEKFDIKMRISIQVQLSPYSLCTPKV